jgi:hypothetical protein
MPSKRVQVFAIASTAFLLLTSCLLQMSQVTVRTYGSMSFYGSEICNSMVMHGRFRDNVELVLSNDVKVDRSSLRRENIGAVFGAPIISDKTPNGTLLEEFQLRECSVTFENERFSYLEVRRPAQICNLTNKKCVTLPASPSQIEEVFGKPTSVGEAQSQQP